MKPLIQQMTFSEFTKLAFAVQLHNHGRKWEVYVGATAIGFSDAGTAEDAKRDIHQSAINNSLYFNDLDVDNFDQVPLPSAAALNEYPDLFEKFPTPAAIVIQRAQLGMCSAQILS